MSKAKLFSDQLRAAVLAADQTRYQIAKATDIQQASLSRFVHGKGRLDMESVDRLCKHLGLNLVGPIKRRD